jgi:hypothetical protein
VDTEQTSCKNGAGPEKKDWPQDLVIEYAAGVLTVTHVNAVFNCCLDDITVSFELGGTALNIYEDEVTPNPCFCECPFDVVTQIEGLEPGVYVVSAYTNGNYQLSETYEIP